MLPVMRASSTKERIGKPHLVLKLKSGWSYRPEQEVFVSSRGKEVSVKTDLPEGSQIVLMVPALATQVPASLSKAERELARYLQVIFPTGTDPADYVAIVKQWPGVGEVTLPPQIDLA